MVSLTARQTKILSLRGGILQGKPMSAEEVRDLASLPPADVLRGQVLGAIVAPLSAIAALINAPLQDLVGLIDARIEQLGGEEAEEAPKEAPEPEAPAEDSSGAEAESEEETTTAEAEASAPESEEVEVAEPNKESKEE